METSTTSSRVVAALEYVWSEIRKRNPDHLDADGNQVAGVPDVYVTVGMGSGTAGSLKLGHFGTHRWHTDDDDPGTHELFVGGEGLKRGPTAVLGTLLHEAAHGVAAARGVQDTSRQGRFHNGRFKAIGEELGLELEKNGFGWSETLVPEKTELEYAEVLVMLGLELMHWRESEFPFDLTGIGGTVAGGDTVKVTKRPTTITPRLKAVISCDCQGPAERRLRMNNDALHYGPITCGVCHGQFTHKLVQE